MSQFPGSLQNLLVLQRQLEVSQYVCAGSAAIFIWDILNNVRSEYSLLFKHKSSSAAVAYVMSRIGALIFVLGFTIFALYPFNDCNTVLLAFNSFIPVAVCGTSFLFVFRVSAIFGGDRIVTTVFGCLWLAAVASSITLPVGESALAIPVGDPTVCIISRAEPYVGASAVILTVASVATFLAISYRLASNLLHTEHQEDAKARGGTNSTIFLRSLLMDGQMYYLIVVLVNISATLMLYIPSVPLPYRGLLVVPNIALTSIMACRVYRNKVLGVRRLPQLTLPTLNRSPDGNTIPLSVVQFEQRTATYMSGSMHLNTVESNVTRSKQCATREG
ncbi:hypothetical protein K438DRAFT_1692478 [Mycena galopus ATCC 62051]|nr:hypothetical protein K438DRAFT_1692478 [Mycena galopus ATCC 62051]